MASIGNIIGSARDQVLSELAGRFVDSGFGESVLRGFLSKQMVPTAPVMDASGFGGTDIRAPVDLRSYGRNSWIYACVKTISQSIASVPIHLKRRQIIKGQEQAVAVPDHRLQQLLDKPNPYMDGMALRFATVAHQELTGDAFWWLVRTGGFMPSWIVLLRPDRVRIIPDKDTFIKGYEYRAGSVVQHILPEDMIHFKYFNPMDDYRGQGTFDPARVVLAMDVDAKNMNRMFFKNAATPNATIETPGNLTTAQIRRYNATIKARHERPENAHKIILLEGGAKWKSIGLSQRDMDFINLLKMTRDEIAAVANVPPPLVGNFERMTYNNADKAVAFFWHQTLIPKIAMMLSTLNCSMDKFMGGAARRLGSDLFFSEDLSQQWALRREELDLTKTRTEEVKWGISTQNQIRAAKNEEPVPWGDIWHRPKTLVPWDTPAVQLTPQQLSAVADRLPPTREMLEAAGEPTLPHVTERPLITVRDRQRQREIAEWKGNVIQSDFYEGLFRGFLGRLFSDQEQLMQARLRALVQRLLGLPTSFDLTSAGATQRIDFKRKPTKADIDAIAFKLDEAVEVTIANTSQLYVRVTNAGGRRAFEQLELPNSFDITDPEAQRHMLAKQQKLAVKVNETSWNAITESLAAGMDDGESITQLADRITDVVSSRQNSKRMIARTEVNGSLNGGVKDGYKQSRVVKGKHWLTAGDAEVRHPHSIIGDETRSAPIPLDDKFILHDPEDALDYPGDPSGQAAQIIHCRCSMQPALKKPGE